MGAQLDSASAPLSYGDPVSEYWTIKKAAGFADISSTGRLTITGKDRVAFLNGLLTNDAAKIDEDGGQHSALLTPKARVLADLYLYRRIDSILIDTGYSSPSKLKEEFDRFIITEDVQVKNSTDDLVLLTIQGPNAGRVIKDTLRMNVDQLKPLHHAHLGPSTFINRDRTGLGGYDLVLPSLEAEPVWQGLLLKQGESILKPVGNNALEILRLEAGYPKYGVDVDQDTIVLEAGFKDAISFTKGCYMGQEVVARATHIGRVNKQLVQLEIDGSSPPQSRSKLMGNGVEAGFVTSASFSPSLGRVAALGYANRDFAKQGTQLTIDDSDGPVSALVTRIL